MYVKANKKGQIVIPAKLRRRLGIKNGTKLYVEEHRGTQTRGRKNWRAPAL